MLFSIERLLVVFIISISFSGKSDHVYTERISGALHARSSASTETKDPITRERQDEQPGTTAAHSSAIG